MDSTFGTENIKDILVSIATSLKNIEQLLQPKEKKKPKEVGRPKTDWKTIAYIWYRARRTYLKAPAIAAKYGVSEALVRKVMTFEDNPAMLEYKRQTGLEAKGEQWLEWWNRELPDDMKKEEYM